MYINGKAAAITGGVVTCGGVTIGSGTVNIGDAPSSRGAMPGNVAITKAITSVYCSYGPNYEQLSGSSRHYTDINVHAKTIGYLPGEKVSIVLSGPVNIVVSGYVDESGEACVAGVLKGAHIEFEGKDMS